MLLPCQASSQQRDPAAARHLGSHLSLSLSLFCLESSSAPKQSHTRTALNPHPDTPFDREAADAARASLEEEEARQEGRAEARALAEQLAVERAAGLAAGAKAAAEEARAASEAAAVRVPPCPAAPGGRLSLRHSTLV